MSKVASRGRSGRTAAKDDEDYHDCVKPHAYSFSRAAESSKTCLDNLVTVQPAQIAAHTDVLY